MILYHGSNTMINVIDLTKSKRYKDFGQAFYLSSEKEQARKMAIAKVVQFGGEESVTSFDFDESSLSSSELSVRCFPGYVYHAFVQKRKYKECISTQQKIVPTIAVGTINFWDYIHVDTMCILFSAAGS